MNHLGFEIKKKRKQLGLTQQDVSKGFMSIAKLSNIENGKVNPDSETWNYLKQKLEIVEDVMDNNKMIEKVHLYLAQAKTYSKTNMIEKAIEKYNQVIEVSKTVYLFRECSMAYSELGSIYIEQREYKLAHFFLLKAIDYYESIADLPNLLDCKMRLGVLYTRQENYSKALEYYSHILNEIPDQLNELKGPLYYNVAILYYKLNDLDNANYACEKALIFLSEKDRNYFMGTLILQAILLKRVKMFLLAREKLEIAREMSTKYNHMISLGKCWHNLGDIELESKNFDKALEYFKLSLEVKENQGDDIGIIRTTAYMAELYLQIEELELARELGTKALRLARKHYLRNEELVCLSTLSKIYATLGERDRFLDLSLKAMTLADALSFHNKKIELLETVAKYFHESGNATKCSEMLYKAFKIKYKLE